MLSWFLESHKPTHDTRRQYTYTPLIRRHYKCASSTINRPYTTNESTCHMKQSKHDDCDRGHETCASLTLDKPAQDRNQDTSALHSAPPLVFFLSFRTQDTCERSTTRTPPLFMSGSLHHYLLRLWCPYHIFGTTILCENDQQRSLQTHKVLKLLFHLRLVSSSALCSVTTSLAGPQCTVSRIIILRFPVSAGSLFLHGTVTTVAGA